MWKSDPSSLSCPSENAMRAWARLVRVQHVLLGEVEAAFKAAGFPPLAWYDVLLELSRAPGGALRPTDLEKQMLLPQYRLSRLLDRLEQAGLVERKSCPEDRRGHWAAITTEGRALQTRMWNEVYAAAIERHVGAKLDAGETATLADLLGRLA